MLSAIERKEKTMRGKMEMFETIYRIPILLVICIIGGGSPQSLGQNFAPTSFDIKVWPKGRIPYRFARAGEMDPHKSRRISDDEVLSAEEQAEVFQEMARWQRALTVPDPADPENRNRDTKHVIFYRCAEAQCDQSYILIRRNFDGEENNMCS